MQRQSSASDSIRPIVAGALAVLAIDQVSKYLSGALSGGRLVCPVTNDSLMLGLPAGTQRNVLACMAGAVVVFGLWVWFVCRRRTVSLAAVAVVAAGRRATSVTDFSLVRCATSSSFPAESCSTSRTLPWSAGCSPSRAVRPGTVLDRPFERSEEVRRHEPHSHAITTAAITVTPIVVIIATIAPRTRM